MMAKIGAMLAFITFEDADKTFEDADKKKILDGILTHGRVKLPGLTRSLRRGVSEIDDELVGVGDQRLGSAGG